MGKRASGPDLSRRSMLHHTGIALVGASVPAVGSQPVAGSAPPPDIVQAAAPELAPLNRAPRTMQDFFVARVRQIEAAGAARRAEIRTKQAAEAYVREVREKIARCFGPWPERTPLSPRVTGIVERDGYRIEKVIFESRPAFPVTANLYVPVGRPYPLPGVVALCGHSANGKAHETYQSFVQGLARQGYVTLIFDPFGQGERSQYGASAGNVRDSVLEHLRAGNQQHLVGEFSGAWHVWDGMRALDYLLSRPEVDRRHVGVTGNSGGGTLTTWLWALEPRWTMGAPSCFVTTLRRNLENELSVDAEQCPPGVLALGLDHADFIAAHAPKPVLLLGQEKDYFDARGLEEAYARLRPLYRLLGAEQNIQLFVGPDVHGYHRANREAMYRWFNRQTSVSDAREEPRLALEKDETLWCTPAGTVAGPAARTVPAFTRAASVALRGTRRALAGAGLIEAVTGTLKLPARAGVPDYRILRPAAARGYPARTAATYAVESEPNVLVFVYRLSDVTLLSRPPRGVKRALLYISHASADAELRDEPLLRELIAAEPESAVYACDVRGVGESRPNTGDQQDLLHHYGSDYLYASHGVMSDYPYAGQRTHDVLQVLEWLAGAGHEEVHLVGKGFGAIPATFAAVLSPRVTQVTLKHALTSYGDVAESEDYRWPLSALLPGVLRRFDLPDCYRALESKRLRQIEPCGAAGVPFDRPGM
jgi:cephalosporin-C deacetylase-like acetyl esterase